MAQLAIKGHETRGSEVIALLKMLGGTNKMLLDGNSQCVPYFIIENVISGGLKETSYYLNNDFKIFTLEEFEEKYPYKVGDKVIYDNSVHEIIDMKWNDNINTISYGVSNGKIKNLAIVEELQPYKEETMEEPEELIVGFTKDNDGSWVLNTHKDYEIKEIDGKFKVIKKQPKYPKTYEEYCEALGYTVDDVIFTNNTGWIKITNKLWDCYAKEHVYEGIGIINGHEYKDIRHHNVTGKIQLGLLKHCKDVDVARYVNSITDDIMINQITNKVSVIKFKPDVCDNKIELHLGDYEIEVQDGKTYAVKRKPKYPTTYEECYEIIGISRHDVDIDLPQPYQQIMFNLFKLRICRDAYWKIAGDWKEKRKEKAVHYVICSTMLGEVVKDTMPNCIANYLLDFPTEEMRDTFYENFKDLIEQCKELL